MVVLFDGELAVSYGYVLLLGLGQEQPELGAARGGQANGLCGAAFPGVLSLVTGTHSGSVPLRVEVLTAEPALGPEWEEVVEVSFATDLTELYLVSFDGAEPVSLRAAGAFRVRYGASGMDLAHRVGGREPGEPVLDRYLLQLWPAARAPDAVLRQTSETAAYWHAAARDTPAPVAPPPPPSAEEVAAAERAAEQLWQREQETAHELWRWGGRPPSERLRAAAGRGRHSAVVCQLARADRELVDAVVELGAGRQRELATWLARRARELAGTAAIDDGPALDALERGETLPPPFDDLSTALTAMFPGGRAVTDVTSRAGSDRPALAPDVAALFTLLAAAEPDPGHAALAALDAASQARQDRAAWFAEVREHLAT